MVGDLASVPIVLADGGEFYSPGSYSQLLPHSSGRLDWICFLTPRIPAGTGRFTPVRLTGGRACCGGRLGGP